MNYYVMLIQNKKALGIDNIPAELFKHGGDVTIDKLTELSIVIWNTECVPSEWTKGYNAAK